MSNHFHLLLEVPPMATGGLSDEVLSQRLSRLYSEAFVVGLLSWHRSAEGPQHIASTDIIKCD